MYAGAQALGCQAVFWAISRKLAQKGNSSQGMQVPSPAGPSPEVQESWTELDPSHGHPPQAVAYHPSEGCPGLSWVGAGSSALMSCGRLS